MGSATKNALRTLKRSIDSLSEGNAASALGLFDAAVALGGSRPLQSALASSSAPAPMRGNLAADALGAHLDEAGRGLLRAFGEQQWSNEDDIVPALQEVAIRAAGQTASSSDQLVTELDDFLAAVASEGELELTLASKLTPRSEKIALVERLFGGKLSNATMRILRSLIEVPSRGRLRRQVLWARDVVADQADRQVAKVTVARSLGEEQLGRLRAGLQRRFGRQVAVNEIVDPSVIGGMRVQLGDEVIDDTAAARLHNLRLQLA